MKSLIWSPPRSRFLYWIGNTIASLGYALDRPASLNNAWCRFRNHPEGTRYYSASSYEEDTTCVTCGEDIG